MLYDKKCFSLKLSKTKEIKKSKTNNEGKAENERKKKMMQMENKIKE